MKDIRSIDMDLAVEMQREMSLRATLKRELGVVLSAWVPDGIPDDFSQIGDCICAMIRRCPESDYGPELLRAGDFSVDDFTLKDMD